MKCNVIRDLMPSYIEGLTSQDSNEEIEKHLADCKECKTYYDEMTGEIDEKIPSTEVQELDYLKKVRKKNRRTIIIAAGAVVAILLVLVRLFVIGFPVASSDMDMTYEREDNHMKLEFALKNGHDLTFRSEHELIYDENQKIIGMDHIYKPVWIFNNPFDDVGSRFSLGAEILPRDSDQEYTHQTIIVFKDKNVTFVNGELVQ